MTTHELFFNPHGAKNLGKDTNTKAAMSHEFGVLWHYTFDDLLNLTPSFLLLEQEIWGVLCLGLFFFPFLEE
jgi:hypothetical protein